MSGRIKVLSAVAYRVDQPEREDIRVRDARALSPIICSQNSARSQGTGSCRCWTSSATRSRTSPSCPRSTPSRTCASPPTPSPISPLAGLTSLQRLGISENRVTDRAVLADADDLHTLHLDNNEITGLSPLGDLPDLSYVDLWE